MLNTHLFLFEKRLFPTSHCLSILKRVGFPNLQKFLRNHRETFDLLWKTGEKIFRNRAKSRQNCHDAGQATQLSES